MNVDMISEPVLPTPAPVKDDHKEYPYRFVILAVYLTTSLVNSLPTNTFAAINSLVEKQFSIPSLLVTLNFLAFPIAHTVFSVPCNWTITRHGIHISYYIAAVLVVGGVWLRTLLSDNNPYYCLLGSVLCAIGGIFMLNSSSKVTFNWFRAEKITVATFLCVLFNLLSQSLGLFLPGLVLDSESTQHDIIAFLQVEALIVSVPFILLVILIRDKPPTPPSKAAEIQINKPHQRYKHLMKELFKNINYIKLAVTMATSYGCIMGFLSILDQGLVGLGYTQPGKIISITVIVATLAGIAGNYVYSIIVKKTRRYRAVAIFMVVTLFIGYVALIIGYFYGFEQIWQLILIGTLFGFNYFSIPSHFVVYGAQLVFPIEQASVAGYLFAMSQTFGFVFGLILSAIFDKTRQTSIILFCVIGGVLLVSSVFSLFIVQDLRKDAFEKEHHKDILNDQHEKFLETTSINNDNPSPNDQQ